MDIRHYFDAVNFLSFSDNQQLNWKYSIGSLVEQKTNALTFDNFEKLDLVIIGIPFDSGNIETNVTEAPDSIRKELYFLTKPKSKLNIVDLGNLKPANSLKGTYQAIRDIVEYFNEINVATLVLGGSQDLTYGVCEAFKSNKFFSLSAIDAFLDVKKGKETFNSTNYFSRVFNSLPELFQFNLIGYQSHFVSTELLSKTKGISNHVRLGRLRDDITLAEPVLRNTDFLSFDIGAIKYAEAPGGNRLTPNGLRSEEACQLAKYAGLSKRLMVFGLFNLEPNKDHFGLTGKLAAQIIWYFIEGLDNRKQFNHSLEENKLIYQVDIKNVSAPLVFIKNKVTNQWWMQFKIFDNKNLIIGCSEKDYQLASNNEIPELWLRYIQKIDEILK